MPGRSWRGLLAGVAVAALVACDPAAPNPHAADPRTAIDGALGALRAQTAVGYGFPGTGSRLTVTGRGLVQGVIPLQGKEIPAVGAGEDLYLRAPADHWLAEGMDPVRAAEYGSRWARTQLGFEPGSSLAPPALADALRKAVPADVAPQRKTVRGIDVYDADGLQVTASPPFRVVAITPALLGPLAAKTLGDGQISVDPLGNGELGPLLAAYRKDVDSLGQPFVAGPVVAASVTDNSLRCDGSGGCTDTVHVDTRPLGSAPRASARLVLKSSVQSGQLGAQDCGQELVAPLTGTATMSCSVKFTLPRVDGSAEVTATPAVSGEPVADVDPVALDRAAADELGH